MALPYRLAVSDAVSVQIYLNEGNVSSPELDIYVDDLQLDMLQTPHTQYPGVYIDVTGE